MSDELSTSSRGRQRVYASASEKVSAFRERNKEAGLLRKEVLVQADIAARLSELAREQGTSVTNVASGLLEMGLAHFEALYAMGYMRAATHGAKNATPSAGPALLQSSSGGTPALIGADLASTLATRGQVSGSLALLQLADASATDMAEPAAMSSKATSNSTAQIANPIAQFFDTRKNRLK